MNAADRVHDRLDALTDAQLARLATPAGLALVLVLAVVAPTLDAWVGVR